MRKLKVTPVLEQAKLTRLVAELRASGAGPLLEALRRAQVDALIASMGERAALVGGLLCVDGFCVEPFLDPANALKIPDYDVTETVEICLRVGPWAKMAMSDYSSEGPTSSTCELE